MRSFTNKKENKMGDKKSIAEKALSINKDSRTMQVVMSTKSVDRDGDIVEPQTA